MLKIKSDTIRTEMAQIVELVESLKALVDAGVPGDDLPAADLHQEIFQVQLRGELLLASQRLMALAEVIE